MVHYITTPFFLTKPMSIIIGRFRKSILPIILVLGTLWMGFGPVQLGGPVSYIVISGNSMEPEIEKGDLVLTRRADQYQVDQQVVYNHPQLGYVFHRIVAQEGDRFILKGDNNTWLDSYHPSREEIHGKYWFDIPGAGDTLVALRQPLLFGLFIVITSSMLVGLVLMPDPNSALKRKGNRKRMKKENPPPPIADLWQDILLVVTVIAAIALIFAIISLGKDAKVNLTDDLLYQHKALLDYSASAKGDIYDSAGVETGDPLYPGLSCVLNLDFAYQLSSSRFTGDDLDQFEGTFSLAAEVRDNDGWHRTIPLVPEMGFSTLKVNARPSLDICSILELIESKEAATGLDIKTYTLTILPEIRINGSLEGLPLEDEFQPLFVFDLSDSVLRVGQSQESFKIEQEGQIPHMFRANNLMGIFGKQVPVISVRWAALVVLGICLGAGLYLAWPQIDEWKRSEWSRIEIQHRPVMIDLKDSQIRKETYTLIELESMGDLRKLADRYGAMIMHEVEGSTHRYLVLDEGFLYQFESKEEQGEHLTSRSGGKESGLDDW